MSAPERTPRTERALRRANEPVRWLATALTLRFGEPTLAAGVNAWLKDRFGRRRDPEQR